MSRGSTTGQRIGGYLLLTDTEGLRHLARISSVSLASETDPCGDELCLVISGRPVRVLASLDEYLEWIGAGA